MAKSQNQFATSIADDNRVSLRANAIIMSEIIPKG
jgi:hypothetical protein